MRVTSDKYLSSLPLRSTAILPDNRDLQSTTVATGGTAHVSAVAASCVALETSLVISHSSRINASEDKLSPRISRRDQCGRDGELWDVYLFFDDAAFRRTVTRIAGDGNDVNTCLELELRYVEDFSVVMHSWSERLGEAVLLSNTWREIITCASLALEIENVFIRTTVARWR